MAFANRLRGEQEVTRGKSGVGSVSVGGHRKDQRMGGGGERGYGGVPTTAIFVLLLCHQPIDITAYHAILIILVRSFLPELLTGGSR